MPRHPSGKILSMELRITPPDQKEITNWKITEGDFEKMLIAMEGTPDGKPRLHYHLYVETKRSKSWLRSWVLCVLVGHYNPDEAINGNSLYFSKSPHEHTIPYVVKSNNIVYRLGYSDQELDGFIKSSQEYCKQKERDRKRKQRKLTDEYNEVFDEVCSEFKELKHHQSIRDDGYIHTFVQVSIDKFKSKNMRMPTRNVMERAVMDMLSVHQPSALRSIYMKSFPSIIV